MRRAVASAADLPVELVEEIFLRLDDASDLRRASAACASFRCVVSYGGFLCRFRSLHRRLVLGLLSSSRCSASRTLCFYPAAPPRRSAQAARAVVRAAGFSSSFLPVPAAADPTTEHCWHVHDARDGRVLLCLSQSDTDDDDDDATCLSFSYLVVYDPLHHKHAQIPPIPTDIMACTCAVQHRCSCCDHDCEFDPFLVPASADEDDLSFRVMCAVLSAHTQYNTVLETFVYSSVTRKWCSVVASLSEADYEPLCCLSSMERHYAHGCFDWLDSYEKDMLVLDMNEMKFSVVSLPCGTDGEFKTVVKTAEEDGIGLLVLRSNHTLHLYSKAFGGANDCRQWRHDVVVVTLLDSYEWFFGGAADQGYALLQGVPRDEYRAWRCSPEEMRPKTSAQYFTVELQTLLVEQLCVTEFNTIPAFLYASFPPPFAPPCI